VGVDALEQRDLAAERDQRDLGRHDPVDRAELVFEVLTQIDRGQPVAERVGLLGLPVPIDGLDFFGQVRGNLNRTAVCGPRAEAEPVGEVVGEPRTEQNRPLVLVEQREGGRRSELEASLTIEAQLHDGRSAGEGAREEDLLSVGRFREREECAACRENGQNPLDGLALGRVHASPFAHHFGSRYSNENGRKKDTPSCAWTLCVKLVWSVHVFGSASEPATTLRFSSLSLNM